MRWLLALEAIVLVMFGVWTYQTHPQVINDLLTDYATPKDELAENERRAAQHTADLEAQVQALTSQLHGDKAAAPPATTESAVEPAPVVSGVYRAPDPLPAQDNWTWNVGERDYTNVVIRSVDADSVSIFYDGGAGTLALSDLSPALQRQLNYDPHLAADSVRTKEANRIKAETDQAIALAAMKEQTGKQASERSQNQTAAPASPDLSAVQIQELERQIDHLQHEADAEDARMRREFERDISLNSNGEIEHNHTMGHSSLAEQDRAQIATLRTQIDQLGSK